MQNDLPTPQEQDFKIQAVDYLKRALEIVKVSFPVDSPHIGRIESKIQKIKEEKKEAIKNAAWGKHHGINQPIGRAQATLASYL